MRAGRCAPEGKNLSGTPACGFSEVFPLPRLWALLCRRLGRLAGGRRGFFFSGDKQAGREEASRPLPSSAQPGPPAGETAPAEALPGHSLPGKELEPSRDEMPLEEQLRQVPPPEQVAQGEEWSAWAAELARRITSQEEPAPEPHCGTSQRQVLVWVPLRAVWATAVGVLLLLGWGAWQLGLKRPEPHAQPGQGEPLAGPQAGPSSREVPPEDALAGAAFRQGTPGVPWQGQVIPLPEASPEPLLGFSIIERGESPGRLIPGKRFGRWRLSAGQQAVVQVRPWTSTQAWWQALQRQSWAKGGQASWDFLAAVVARGEAAWGAPWLPWSRAAWDDRPRVWYEVGGDPLAPQARWLLVVVQAPAPAPGDDRPQDLIVVVAPSGQFRRSYSFLALSEELAHMAARARPADRLLVLGNGGRLQLPLARLARRGAALEELRRLREQDPDQLRRLLQQAAQTARQWSSSQAAAGRGCRLVIVTDLPWWTASAGEALAWARRWGEHLRRVGQVALVRPRGPAPAGDGWPLVAALWRARQFRWRHAEHLRQVLWQASPESFGTAVRLSLQIGWYGEEVSWLEFPAPGLETRAGEPLGPGVLPPGGLAAVMIRFGSSASGRGERVGPRRLLGWVQVRWQSGSRPVRSLRRPLGAPGPKSFGTSSPLFRAAWLSVHAAQLSPGVLARPPLAPCWHDLAAPGSPRRWRQLVRLVEKGDVFD